MEKTEKNKKLKIPEEVMFVVKQLEKNGFESYVVGGCVRDILRGEKPSDWDITTNAAPQEIGKIFPHSYSDNKFGTVTVLTQSQDITLKEIEITPFRTEAKYTDKRHPSSVKWAKTIEEDLSRRDFIINAIAIKIENINTQADQLNFKIIDLFKGRKDLEKKIIKTVGNPEERFNEDALRMLRAVRFAVSLGEGWTIEEKTKEAIKKNSFWLSVISKERIRDELVKIIMTKKAAWGIELLRQLNLLKHIIPELEEGYRVTQNKHHIFDCYVHALMALDFAAKKSFNFYVRMAALLHDVAKPRTKRGEGDNATFYGHEIVGAQMAAQILTRLKFKKTDIEKIVKLIRYHLFYYNVGEVGESSVRRLVKNVGLENIEELLQLRMADRIGSGCPKAEPYKLRHLKYMIEKVSQDPISFKMLDIKGDDIMKILSIKPGPKVGQVLDILLGIVLDDPEKNKKEILEKEVEKLKKLSDEDLKKIAETARKQREKIETKRDEMTKQKYWIT